jgi:hypothetical protein
MTGAARSIASGMTGRLGLAAPLLAAALLLVGAQPLSASTFVPIATATGVSLHGLTYGPQLWSDYGSTPYLLLDNAATAYVEFTVPGPGEMDVHVIGGHKMWVTVDGGTGQWLRTVIGGAFSDPEIDPVYVVGAGVHTVRIAGSGTAASVSNNGANGGLSGFDWTDYVAPTPTPTATAVPTAVPTSYGSGVVVVVVPAAPCTLGPESSASSSSPAIPDCAGVVRVIGSDLEPQLGALQQSVLLVGGFVAFLLVALLVQGVARVGR